MMDVVKATAAPDGRPVEDRSDTSCDPACSSVTTGSDDGGQKELRTLPDKGTDGMANDLKILVVDDEKRILQTFSLMLSEYGFFLKTASNSEEAMAHLAKDRFDIVFLDCYIGKERGLDLMQKLTAAAPGLYFVMITANGSADLAVEALKQGASDFIAKPFFVADIIKSIGFVNKKRELDRQKREMLLTLEAKVQERTRELQAIHIDVLSSLAQALETRDFSTYGHCKRVSHYARMIAEELHLSESEQHYLEIAALLHDVGKIGINDSILLKPGRLDGHEWDSLKHHPSKGVEILKPLKYLEPALPAILHHHEFYDGTGYPGGLKGEAIPLNARIIAIADAWDVMRSDRPYRKALSYETATDELLKHGGKQFDPFIVETFLTLV